MKIFNYFPWLKKEKIIIFGTGALSKKLTQNLPFNVKVMAYSDNNEATHGNQFLGKVIISPKELTSYQFDYLIIASQAYKAIETGLIQSNVITSNKIAYFSRYQLKPSPIKNFFERHVFDLICCVNTSFSRALLNRFFVAKGTRLKKLQWLDTQTQCLIKEFEAETTFNSVGPNYCYQTQPKAKISMPKVAAYRFKDAMIESSSRLILTANTAIVERGFPTKASQGDFCGGSIVKQSVNSVIYKQYPHSNIAKGIVINGVAESNYYHCIIETLSQLNYLSQLDPEFKHYPILIAHNLLAIPSVKACFDSLKINNPVIKIAAGEFINVNDLIIISTPNNNLAINLKYGNYQPTQNYFRSSSLDFIRNHALTLLPKNNSNANKRTFIARKGPIRSYNQKEVQQLLENYGFDTVYTEEMTYLEQVSLFQQSQYIVGPTGAAWTNLLFAKSGAKALCWQAENLANFSCFSNLANIYDVDLKYLTYSAQSKDTRELFYASYTIDINQIKNWLQGHLLNSETYVHTQTQ